MNRAGSDPAFSGNFENALTSPQMTQDSLFDSGGDLRPPQPLCARGIVSFTVQSKTVLRGAIRRQPDVDSLAGLVV